MTTSPIPMPNAVAILPDRAPVPERCAHCRATVRDLVRDDAGRWRLQLLHGPHCPANPDAPDEVETPGLRREPEGGRRGHRPPALPAPRQRQRRKVDK